MLLPQAHGFAVDAEQVGEGGAGEASGFASAGESGVGRAKEALEELGEEWPALGSGEKGEG